ncbi:hypothetical protein LXL04_005295 [Taraxacum kok-saghyz]
MNPFKHVRSQFHLTTSLRTKKLTSFIHLNPISYHSSTESHLNPQSSEWRERALPKLIKLTPLLNNLDLINGKLINIHDKSTVNDEFLLQSMHNFKSIATSFLAYHSIIESSSTSGTPSLCLNKPTYMEPLTLNSLKKVCDILDVSAQQRKLVRLAICPQITHHQIWTRALEEVLNQLKIKLGINDHESIMTRQIVVNCLMFLDDVISYDPNSTSWMRLAPTKKDSDFPRSAKWEDFLEMLNDLIICLKNEEDFFFYVTKLESMKEGLLQIKDVIVDKNNIGYKEARHQESLVQKKLTKSLGHSSRCLFTLLLYYLYGGVGDIEVDICCWFSEGGKCNNYLCVGKILTFIDEKMVRREVKKLDRAIGVIRFVYEMAEMKEVLEVRGHLWGVGCENRSVVYRGNKFFIHGIGM